MPLHLQYAIHAFGGPEASCRYDRKTNGRWKTSFTTRTTSIVPVAIQRVDVVVLSSLTACDDTSSADADADAADAIDVTEVGDVPQEGTDTVEDDGGADEPITDCTSAADCDDADPCNVDD